MKTVAMIVLLGLARSLNAELCPNETLIQPCNCTSDGNSISLKCSANDFQKVCNIFDSVLTNETKLETVDLESSKLIVMRNQFFGNLQVKKAIFRFPNLQLIRNGAFEGQENGALQSVIWTTSSMSHIPTSVLKNVTGLKEVQFKGSNAYFVEKWAFDDFASAHSLEVLSLSGGNLISIHNGSLSNLVNLRRLDLSKNLLSQLKGLPTRFNHKIDVNLSWNKFQKIPSDLLDKLAVHSSINLRNNHITSDKLDVKDFRKIVTRHLTLDIQGNELECSCPLLIVALANAQNHKPTFFGSCQPMGHNDTVAFKDLTYDHLKGCYLQPQDSMAFINSDLFYDIQ